MRGLPVRRDGREPRRRLPGLPGMRHKPQPPEFEQQDRDDVWAWIVIGAIYCAVTILLFAPLVWRATHSSL